jgi:Acetyltransferase (GNAT) family
VTASAIVQTSPAYRIRSAAHGDVTWLVDAWKAFAEYYGLSGLLFPIDDPEQARVLVGIFVTSEIVMIATHHGEPVGFIAGTLAPHALNHRVQTLTEVAWWVIPEYRNTRAGFVLLNAFEHFGERNKADLIVMTLLPKSQVKEESLAKRGYALYEMSYVRRVYYGEG